MYSTAGVNFNREKNIITQTHTYIRMSTHTKGPALTGCELCFITQMCMCVCVYVCEEREVVTKMHNATNAYKVWPLYVRTQYIRYISNCIAIISMPFDSLFAFHSHSMSHWAHRHINSLWSSISFDGIDSSTIDVNKRTEQFNAIKNHWENVEHAIQRRSNNNNTIQKYINKLCTPYTQHKIYTDYAYKMLGSTRVNSTRMHVWNGYTYPYPCSSKHKYIHTNIHTYYM